jgi:hypothetical protein
VLKLGDKEKLYLIYALLAALLSLGAGYVNREKAYKASEASLKEAKRLAEGSLVAALQHIETMKASAKRATNSDRDSKVTTMPDGTRVEELHERIRSTEELWAETTKAYTARIEQLERENTLLKESQASEKIVVSKPHFRPVALGLYWQGSRQQRGQVDLDLGYHFDFGSFDLGPHIGTPVAGDGAALPLDERAFRVGVQGRF